MPAKKLTFEEAITQLEEVVIKLEDNSLTLDESVALYQKGMELSKICNTILTEAQEKIKTINEK